MSKTDWNETVIKGIFNPFPFSTSAFRRKSCFPLCFSDWFKVDGAQTINVTSSPLFSARIQKHFNQIRTAVRDQV